MDVFQMIETSRKAQIEANHRDEELKAEFAALKVKKLSPFDFLNSIRKKEYILTPDNENQYSAFMINRGLSQSIENVVHAFNMDQMSALPVDMQYDYHFHSTRKSNQRTGWVKAPKYDVDLIMEIYEVSQKKAIEIASRLTPEQHSQLTEWYNDRGGMTR